MKETVFVRPYQLSDLDAVIAIFLGAIREIAARDYNPAQVDAWAQADRGQWALQRLSRPTWTAVIDQQLVGFSDLEPDGHLDMMFVHPAYQGMGVATALLERIEASARDQCLGRIFTEASITSRPFFKGRGFRVITQQTVERWGQEFTNFNMEKLLI